MPSPVINEVISDYEEALLSSKTYKLDLDKKRITGYIDREEAIKQYVQKLLMTERVTYSVYGTEEGINYGVELQRFIGQNISFIKSDIERTISEALLQDERILQVTDFVIGELNRDMLDVSFTVSTVFGTVEINKEVFVQWV